MSASREHVTCARAPPRQIFEPAAFASRLVRLVKHPRRVLTATTTPTEVTVGGLGPAFAAADIGFGAGDLHPLDYSLFLYNLRENAGERLAAFEARRARSKL